MTETERYETEAVETGTRDIYLPAVTVPPQFGRIERAVSALFDFHGVVLIPDSYNK